MFILKLKQEKKWGVGYYNHCKKKTVGVMSHVTKQQRKIV